MKCTAVVGSGRLMGRNRSWTRGALLAAAVFAGAVGCGDEHVFVFTVTADPAIPAVSRLDVALEFAGAMATESFDVVSECDEFSVGADKAPFDVTPKPKGQTFTVRVDKHTGMKMRATVAAVRDGMQTDWGQDFLTVEGSVKDPVRIDVVLSGKRPFKGGYCPKKDAGGGGDTGNGDGLPDGGVSLPDAAGESAGGSDAGNGDGLPDGGVSLPDAADRPTSSFDAKMG